MRKTIIFASIIGFAIPLLWSIAAFVLFNMRESAASNVFWASIYITCPFWVLPGLWGSIAMLPLNAALYGLVGFAIRSIARKTRAK